jgi:hypothetical protein
MASYYQIVRPISDFSNIFQKATERHLNPNALSISADENIILFEISPQNLNNFDKLTNDLSIDNLIFSTLDFEKIIQYAFDTNVKIRKIQTTEISEDLREIFDGLVKEKNTQEIINFLKENDINIKELEIYPDNNIIRLYDSGIIWADSDLSKSERIKNFFIKILKFVI